MIRISTRFLYGLRALLELAKSYPDAPVSVNQIAKLQKISPKYLEQIMSQLKAGGIVHSQPGINGGYRLLRAPSDLQLLDIAIILEGKLAITECAVASNICQNEGQCPTRKLWQKLNHSIEEILSSTTLNQIMNTESLPTE